MWRLTRTNSLLEQKREVEDTENVWAIAAHLPSWLSSSRVVYVIRLSSFKYWMAMTTTHCLVREISFIVFQHSICYWAKKLQFHCLQRPQWKRLMLIRSETEIKPYCKQLSWLGYLCICFLQNRALSEMPISKVTVCIYEERNRTIIYHPFCDELFVFSRQGDCLRLSQATTLSNAGIARRKHSGRWIVCSHIIRKIFLFSVMRQAFLSCVWLTNQIDQAIEQSISQSMNQPINQTVN